MRSTKRHATIRTWLAAAAVVGAAALGGCQTDRQTGALAGAGIGALAGQAIGGSTKGTLIGAAVGTGVGYVVGNERDKKKAREMSQANARADHTEVGPLGGTRWRLVSLVPRDTVEQYTSKIVEFRPNGHVVTTTTQPDGTVIVSEENYRVVGTTLIVNKPGYLVNARFGIDGDQLVVDAEDFRAVLQRLFS
jgi:hypothetical protein